MIHTNYNPCPASSNESANRFGFSTGALELGACQTALAWMSEHNIKTVELSALRYDELEPLVRQLDNLDLERYQSVSFHAPSSFSAVHEERVVELLQEVHARNWNIVIHPDVIHSPERWNCFGSCLLIENMDRRKPVGRTPAELGMFFDRLPNARLCLNVAHARQMDSTLSLLRGLIRTFRDRIAEVHISELDARCKHVPMTDAAVEDYHQFASAIPKEAPVVIESMLNRKDNSVRLEEFNLARRAMASDEPRGSEHRQEIGELVLPVPRA